MLNHRDEDNLCYTIPKCLNQMRKKRVKIVVEKDFIPTVLLSEQNSWNIFQLFSEEYFCLNQMEKFCSGIVRIVGRV